MFNICLFFSGLPVKKTAKIWLLAQFFCADTVLFYLYQIRSTVLSWFNKKVHTHTES
jgi:hypothetical protein